MRKIMVVSLLFLFWGVKTLRLGFHLENAEKGNTTSVKMKYNNEVWAKQNTSEKNSNYSSIVLSNCCCLLEGVEHPLIVDCRWCGL